MGTVAVRFEPTSGVSYKHELVFKRDFIRCRMVIIWPWFSGGGVTRREAVSQVGEWESLWTPQADRNWPTASAAGGGDAGAFRRPRFARASRLLPPVSDYRYVSRARSHTPLIYGLDTVTANFFFDTWDEANRQSLKPNTGHRSGGQRTSVSVNIERYGSKEVLDTVCRRPATLVSEISGPKR